MTRRAIVVCGGLLTAAHLAIGQTKGAAKTVASKAAQAPRFQVEMMWPKPMDNKWILGSVTGLDVDSRDHVFVLNTPDYLNTRTEIGTVNPQAYGECCVPAPWVVEYDAAGALVGHWGGPGDGYDWPKEPSGLAIDPKGNVWIGGAAPTDTRVLVFSKEGKFLMQVGKAAAAEASATREANPADTAYAGVSPGAAGRGGRGGARGGRGGRGRGPACHDDGVYERQCDQSLDGNNESMDVFAGPTSIAFDPATNEAFIADGIRNRRVVVVDMTTGAFKRRIGGSGGKPQNEPSPPYDPSTGAGKQFHPGMLCVKRAKDGMLYVCDTRNDRIQVFRSTGEFVKEQTIAPETRGVGSVWDVAFSRDAGQKYLYVADGQNEKIHVLDRATLNELTSFGDGGRVPGEFYGVRALAVDSKGNLYTGEYFEGKRVQKFDYEGVGSVTKANEGVLWPRSAGKGGER